MKRCTNCGNIIEDIAQFCEQCGAKQDANTKKNTHVENQNNGTKLLNLSAPRPKWAKGSSLIVIIAITLLIVSIFSSIRSCSPPKAVEDVASEFTEASAIDFNAKKVISLMSQDLIDTYMNKMGFSSKNELISWVNKSLKVKKEDTIAYYGDDWKAKIIEVEIESLKKDSAIVIVSVSHKGSDALWDTNIDKWRIYLKEENGKWRVYNFQE